MDDKIHFTRSDGLGQRVLAFLAAADAAEKLDQPFDFLWLNKGGMRDHQTSGHIGDLFQDVAPFLTFVEDFQSYPDRIELAPQYVYWKGVVSIKPLADQLSRLSLTDQLSSHVVAQDRFKYGVHARLNDVAENVPTYGLSKWQPPSMYELLFRKLAETTDGSDVFVASDSDEIRCLAKRILPRCTDDSFYFEEDDYALLNDAQRLWLIITQLSKSDILLSPPCTAFGLLAKLHPHAYHSTQWITPAEYLGLSGLHVEYLREIRKSARVSDATTSASRVGVSWQNKLRNVVRSARQRIAPSPIAPRPINIGSKVVKNGKLMDPAELARTSMPTNMESYVFD